MIQTVLAAQTEAYKTESADNERIRLADFEDRLRRATAVKTPPASPDSSTRSTVKRTTLDMGSSHVYNGLGGTSSSTSGLQSLKLLFIDTRRQFLLRLLLRRIFTRFSLWIKQK